MNKEVKITPPEGYEVDKENSTFECIKFRPVTPLPTTWEEFCKNHPFKVGESWFDNIRIRTITSNQNDIANYCRLPERDKNVLPSKQYVEAMLALCQLIQLRDCYNKGWQPDWTDHKTIKFCLCFSENNIIQHEFTVTNTLLAFKSRKLLNEFLKNFRDLIEIAKPLL